MSFLRGGGARTQVELTRLRRRVDTLERQIEALAQLLDIDTRRLPQPQPVCSPQVVALARDGKTIAAIKLHRQQTGADLLTAKLDVEQATAGD